MSAKKMYGHRLGQLCRGLNRLIFNWRGEGGLIHKNAGEVSSAIYIFY